MDIVSTILLICLVLELGGIVWFLLKKNNKQSQDERLRETTEMVKKILLNNRWERIDDMIDLLVQDGIHIEFKLR